MPLFCRRLEVDTMNLHGNYMCNAVEYLILLSIDL